MRNRRIPDSDSLYRHCIYPASYRNKGKYEFAFEKFFHLVSDDKTGTINGSLAWERYLPTIKYVHSYGCRLALNRNERERLKGTAGGRRHIYCGAYRLDGSSIRALATANGLNEISSADVVHQIEKGEIAHAALTISLKQGNFDVEGTKTAIVDRLWNACSGPLKYIADCDQDINPHPSLVLISSSAGTYSDTHSYLYRLWSLIRFKICTWCLWGFSQDAKKKLRV